MRLPVGLRGVDDVSVVRVLVAGVLALGWYAVSATVLVALPSTTPTLPVLLTALAVDVVVVLVCSRVVGIVGAIPVGVAAVVAIDWHLVEPVHEPGVPDVDNSMALALYVLAGVLLGCLATVVQHRATASERGRRLLVDEQAALRRVATLVARGTRPDAVFAAVADEARLLLDVDIATLLRFQSDATATIVAWASAPDDLVVVGSALAHGTDDVIEAMRRTGRPAHSSTGPTGASDAGPPFRTLGVRSTMGAPVPVAGHLWGAMLVCSKADLPFAAVVEERVTAFTELVSIAISSTQARVELEASRARIVARSDEARRLLERDLHDGIQQRLVSLALQVRTAAAGATDQQTRDALDTIAACVSELIDELRELSHGLHPAILSSGGLRPALATLARRSEVPAELRYEGETDLPQPTEIAAYYVVSEALTNIAKHAHAHRVEIDVDVRPTELELRITDDGRGGASLDNGSGLVGLTDRVEALGGAFEVTSPPDLGTALTAVIPYASVPRPT